MFADGEFMIQRILNRINDSVHQVRIFQKEIFWPVLESIYEGKLALAELDGEENEILRKLIEQHSLTDIGPVLQRQREIAAAKEEREAEIARKWNLIHAGCNFIAMLLNENREENEERLTPHEVYRSLATTERPPSPSFSAMLLS